MCEILIDDFSLLNARTDHPDVYIRTMGSNSGFDIGNAEAVHRVVESFLRFDQIVRTDDWTPKVQTIPIQVRGANRAAIGDMTARMRLALQRPKRVRLVPCDGWGAPAWWRIAWAQMDAVSNDYALAPTGEERYAAFTITLGTEAWAHSTELFTAVADSNVADVVLWDVDVDLDTGWVASGGTLAYSAGNYVGVNSDVSSATTDQLTKASLVWDALPYTLMLVEWTCNDIGPFGPGSEPPYPYVEVPDGPYLGAGVNRVDMGSGWFQETFLLVDGLTATNAGIRVALGGTAGDTDLKIRKITLAAGSAAGPYHNLWFDMPGSAPTATSIGVTGDADVGMFLYTCPNLPETQLMPVLYEDDAGAVWPPGLYHLIIRFSTDADALAWEVTGNTFDGSDVIQSGEVAIQDMEGWPFGFDQWTVLANDIVLPAQALPAGQLATAAIDITKVGGTTLNVDAALLVWMGNPLTGENSPAYTLLETQAGRSIVRVEAPSPERPVWGVFGGSDADDLYQEHRAIQEVGKHQVSPGESRVFVALAAGEAAEIEVTAEAYPAWDYIVPPESRWPTS